MATDLEVHHSLETEGQGGNLQFLISRLIEVVLLVQRAREQVVFLKVRACVCDESLLPGFTENVH